MMRGVGIAVGVLITNVFSNLSTAQIFQLGVFIFLAQACGRILLWYYQLSNVGGLRERHAVEFIKYNFQKWYVGDPSAKLLSLFWATSIIFITGALVVCQSSNRITLQSAMFMTGEWLANPGAMFQLEDSDLTMVSLAVTCGGLLVFAVLIGIVSDNVEEKLEGLRTGKADVATEGHSVVLGWTNKTIATVRELAQTYPRHAGHAIVVLSARTKRQMETDVQAQLDDEDLNGCVIVCRCGDVCSKHDLLRVAITTARSVVVLNAAVIGDDGETYTQQALPITLQVRSVLDDFATANSGPLNAPARPQIVVEVSNTDEQACVEMVLNQRCATVLSDDIVGRVLLNCTVTPLLQSAVLTLLSFTGAEIYVRHVPDLRGKTFKFVHFCFKGAIPVGVHVKEPRFGKAGRFYLNPPDSYVMREDDAVVLIADDADSFVVDLGPNCASADDSYHMTIRHYQTLVPQNFLVVNWRRGMGKILLEMDGMVPGGSTVTLFDHRSVAQQRASLLRDGLQVHLLKNLSILHVKGSSMNLDDLTQVQTSTGRRQSLSTPNLPYTAVLILATEDMTAERCMCNEKVSLQCPPGAQHTFYVEFSVVFQLYVALDLVAPHDVVKLLSADPSHVRCTIQKACCHVNRADIPSHSTHTVALLGCSALCPRRRFGKRKHCVTDIFFERGARCEAIMLFESLFNRCG
eukprot:m.363654 g.363654  ORF g.363654 m.363654 type:complete len:689 (-) comp20804_c0_seq3:625-2691(-)